MKEANNRDESAINKGNSGRVYIAKRMLQSMLLWSFATDIFGLICSLDNLLSMCITYISYFVEREE